jgi:hypothetical protein
MIELLYVWGTSITKIIDNVDNYNSTQSQTQTDHKFELYLGFRVRLCLKKKKKIAGCWWLMPVILATKEAKMWRTEVPGQPLGK